MLRSLIVWLLFGISQSPSLPAEPGIYCKPDSAAWIRLEAASIDRSKMKGMETFVQNDGLTNMNTTFSYRGARASVRFKASQPVFHARGIDSVQDALIVRLSQRKDDRL